VRIARAGDLPGEGFALYVAPEAAAVVWEALRAEGAHPVGFDALDTLRIEAMRPWWGSDVTEENLLHETGLVGECHSPTKGCYLGQEVVARLQARGGNVNKALRGLRLGAPVSTGATVTVDGKDVGRVTTAAVSPRLGPVALAYVHRNHFAAGTGVEAGGVPATVVTTFEERAARTAGE
jgi:folate-binding protein YgfZ